MRNLCLVNNVFCSGCPHNTSTVKLPEAIVLLEGGCHLMAMFDDDGHAFGTTHMGGEGAQWVGMEHLLKKTICFKMLVMELSFFRIIGIATNHSI